MSSRPRLGGERPRWLALQQGNLAALENWVQAKGLDLAQPAPPREAECVMAARILIALQDHQGALDLIERLLAMAEAGERGGVVIELLLLQALTLQEQGMPDSALDVLKCAVTLAGREGYVHLFVDEGEAMYQFLRRFAAALAPAIKRHGCWATSGGRAKLPAC